MTAVAVAAPNPEAIAQRFVDRARIGPLLVLGIAVALAMGAAHDYRTAPDTRLVVAGLAARGIFVAGAFLFARTVIGESLRGTLSTRMTFVVGILVALGIVLIHMVAKMATREPLLEPRALPAIWPLALALWALTATFVGMGWLQTRLTRWLGPVYAAAIVAIGWAALQFCFQVLYLRRPIVVPMANAGYFVLPVLRMQTASLGACALALFLSQVIIYLLGLN